MDLGITSLAIASEAFFPQINAFDGLDLLAEHGYNYVELSDQTKPSFLDGSPSELEKIRKRAEAADVTLWTAHSPCTWTNLSGPVTADRAESIEVHKRCLDGLASLGVPHFVIHPIEAGEPDDYDEKFRLGLDAVMRLREHAAQYGITLLLENLPFFPPEEALQMLSLAGPEGLGIVIDTGHETMKGRSVSEALRMTADHLVSLHLHDNHAEDAGDEHLPPTYGTTNWPDVMNALELVHYNGPYIIEALPINPPLAEMSSEQILTTCRDAMKQAAGVTST